MKITLALLVAILFLCASPLAVAQTRAKGRGGRPAAKPAARPAAKAAAKAAATPAPAKTPAAPKKDLMAVLKDANDLKTFASLLQKSDVLKTLQRGGPYTVLAPSDFAFHSVAKDKMDAITADKDKLVALMRGLIAPSRQRTVDMMYSKEIKMLDGETRASSSKDYIVHIEDAKIINKDMEYDGGIVHEIDTVLMPKVMPEAKASLPAVQSTEVKAAAGKKGAKGATGTKAGAKGSAAKAATGAKAGAKSPAGTKGAAGAKGAKKAAPATDQQPPAQPAPQPAQAWRPPAAGDGGADQ